jgi:hypothetical protein
MKTYFGISDLFEEDLKRRVAKKKEKNFIFIFLEQKIVKSSTLLFCFLLFFDSIFFFTKHPIQALMNRIYKK